MLERPRQNDSDFQREIEVHLQIEADRLVADGRTRDEACDAARRAFGNVTRTRERFYEAGRARWLERLSRDLGHAWRQIRCAPVSSDHHRAAARPRHRRQHGDLLARRPDAAASPAGRAA